LIPQSQNFSSATWLKVDGATVGATVADPFGGNSAFTLIFSSALYSRIEQNISSGSQTGDVVTVSVYLRADSNTTIFTRFGLESFAAFNVTTSWQRFTYTGVVSPIGLYPQLNNAFSGAKTIYAYGFQVERHPTARAYIPTTTAAVYGPRFDHDPVTLACKGLLIEEGRTNLATYSEDFSQAVYGKTGVSISSVAETSPSGGATIQKLLEDTSTGAHGISFANSSGIQTLSIFCKSAGRQWVRLTGNGVVTWFDLQNGVIGTVGAGHTALITNFGNGWYRCSISFTEAGFGGIQIRAATGDTNLTYTGDGASGIFLWGVQLEVGSFPTSYIPTTTGTLARSADVCSITGGDFNNFYNQSEGTLFANATPQTVDQVAVVVGVNTTTFQNSHLLYKINSTAIAAGKRWVANTNVAGPTQSSLIPTPTDIAVSRGILSYAYKLNDMAFAANGTLIGTDNNGTMPFPTVMRIGGRDDGLQLNGHLASIRYYKKRLPNAKLVQLTV
jgi:hypothetical protein